jgi:hypothetical protein
MSDIDKILRDLYLLDPQLKEYESEIKKIIMKLLESKPNIKLNQEFVLDLKKELEIKTKNMFKTPSTSSGLVRKINLVQKLSYVFGGAVICAILILSMNYYIGQKNNSQLAFVSKIEKLEQRAFGPLKLEGGAGVSNDANVLEVKGLGGGPEALVNEKILIPAPSRVHYNFTYQGEDLVLNHSQMEVLKRNKENKSTLPTILKNMDLGLVDLKGVQKGKLQNINIMEDREYGYMINVNFQEGMIAIYQNWDKWPQDTEKDLSLDDVPSEDELINMSNKFIQEKGINLENYGNPYVNDSWKNYSHPGINKDLIIEEEVYVPRSIPVIYPLILEGKEVFDQGGTPSGISVNVDIKYKKVSGAWNIKTQDYQSSFYETETDSQRILDIVQAGGMNYHRYGQAEKIIDLELTSPELIYITYYQYEANQSQEMIVPALRFKVKENEEVPYKLDYILVPLLKEMLDDLENQEDQPILFRQ